jgi:kynurenine formamidase
MKMIDLTHPFSIHTPGWVGYPSPKLSYFQRFATQGIVSQMLELPLHSGTHVENLGGDLAAAETRRCLIGAFPIPIVGGEASPCRVVAFVDG